MRVFFPMPQPCPSPTCENLGMVALMFALSLPSPLFCSARYRAQFVTGRLVHGSASGHREQNDPNYRIGNCIPAHFLLPLFFMNNPTIQFITEVPGGAPVLGPYSPATSDGKYLFVSGQTPYDPAIGRINRGTIAEQTRLVLENIDRILTAAGASRENVASCRIYLQDLNQETFREMNEVYGSFFGSHKPARATVGADLLGMDVEIEAVAVLPTK